MLLASFEVVYHHKTIQVLFKVGRETRVVAGRSIVHEATEVKGKTAVCSFSRRSSSGSIWDIERHIVLIPGFVGRAISPERVCCSCWPLETGKALVGPRNCPAI